MSRNPKTGGRPAPKQININALVNSLSEDELYALHNGIVERLRVLQRQRAQQDMGQFRLGDVVRFTASDGREISGVLIRLNQKSVSVHTDSGNRWTVSPAFLTLVSRPAFTVDAARAEPVTLEHLSGKTSK